MMAGLRACSAARTSAMTIFVSYLYSIMSIGRLAIGKGILCELQIHVHALRKNSIAPLLRLAEDVKGAVVLEGHGWAGCAGEELGVLEVKVGQGEGDDSRMQRSAVGS